MVAMHRKPERFPVLSYLIATPRFCVAMARSAVRFAAHAKTQLRRRSVLGCGEASGVHEASSDQRILDWAESYNYDLIRYLHQELDSLNARGLRASHWIVGPSWSNDLRDLKDAYGVPLCDPELTSLYGIPVHINSWARIPELVPSR